MPLDHGPWEGQPEQLLGHMLGQAAFGDGVGRTASVPIFCSLSLSGTAGEVALSTHIL